MGDLRQRVIELRREFHRYAEPGFEEHKTAARIEQVLDELGIPHRRVAGTGVVGVIEGATPGKTVALRADIDALNQTERTGLPFASENPGMMHACGHDAHAAGLLGAAMVLAGRRESLAGRVVLLFQPAEELGTGAQAMLDEGALDGVDAVFGMHVFPQMPVGYVSLGSGPMLAGGDRFRITFRGKGGHGAMPHTATDALAPACATLLGLQSLVTKEFDAAERVVLTAGQIHGGSRFNVVADEAWIEGTARYFRPETGAELAAKMRRLAEATAAAYGTEAQVDYTVLIPPTVNDAALTEVAREAAGRALEGWRACAGGNEGGRPARGGVIPFTPIMGSEDFAFFSAAVPGTFAGVGAGETPYPNHHPQFDIDEGVLDVLVRMHVAFAETYLGLG